MPKIKSTTDHWNSHPKEWKISAWGEKSTCLTACSPARFMSTKKFSVWIYWKVFHLFSTNEATQFISCGIGHSYFSGNVLPLFLLWYDLKILVKPRGVVAFLYLASSVNGRQKFFFTWKINILSFIFLIWAEQFLIWLIQKLTKNVKISIVF